MLVGPLLYSFLGRYSLPMSSLGCKLLHWVINLVLVRSLFFLWRFLSILHWNILGVYSFYEISAIEFFFKKTSCTPMVGFYNCFLSFAFVIIIILFEMFKIYCYFIDRRFLKKYSFYSYTCFKSLFTALRKYLMISSGVAFDLYSGDPFDWNVVPF